ncbi:MAG: phosphatase PAP2 family protein [Gammaproteobacteria bacterium]
MYWKPLTKFLLISFVIAINVSIIWNIKNTLKWVFGRTWPLTWINNNPSLIKNHVFGFHFFHGGIGYSSFPSGHATVLATVITTLWVFYPKWRWLYIIIGLAVIFSLLALDYHFVSDIIAGFTLGVITGLYANCFIMKAISKNPLSSLLSR